MNGSKLSPKSMLIKREEVEEEELIIVQEAIEEPGKNLFISITYL
jgi:hypothetical protein